ncbi:MAG: ferrochelatase [SAR324 cluster bacterium]|nr:ferrochelatase [SAR324 cluster bacterium]
MDKPKKVLLLAQLGSPTAPTPEAVKSYLKEFLSDPRVMNLPAIPKALLLHGIILRKRPKAVAPKYKKVWLPEGSPLAVHTEKLAVKVNQALGEEWDVRVVMRYGQNSLSEALEKLKKERPTEVVLLPLFPQQAGATTGSLLEEACRKLQSFAYFPNFRFVTSFFDHEKFISAWVNQGKKVIQKGYDHVLFSFHGLPESQILGADPNNICLKVGCCENPKPQGYCYKAQCHQTAHKIATGLGVTKENYSITFQSRMGKSIWIGPATDTTITELAKNGTKKLVVFSPAFVADCLETLEELAIGEKENFLENGGEDFFMVPSLNDNDDFVALIEALVKP